MSGLRSRRVVDRDAEPTDLFSSSMIFGNASTGPAAQQQSFATSPFSAGAPYLLDGSAGSRRSPGGSLRQSPGQSYSEHSRVNQSPPTGGARAMRTSRPPITSLLEKKSRGGLAPGRSVDFDSQRTPRTNMMDRTHMSMSVANTPYHLEGDGGLGDISFVSDGGGGGGAFGAYSGGFNIDSGGSRRLPTGRMQTPFTRKSRLGYADEDEDEDGDVEYQGMDRRNADNGVSTPTWGRDNQSAASSGGVGRMQGSGASERDRASGVSWFEDSRGDQNSRGSHSHSYQGNRMMFGTDFDSNSRQESSYENRDVFDQLDAAWLVWVVVSGVPLGSSSSSSASSVSKVLMRMQAFGTVMEHSLSSGNWMFIKFGTPYEAGRAAAEPVTFLGSGLDSHVMLSCTQLSSALARSLNLHIDDAGALAQGSGLGLGKGVISSPFPSSRHNESQSRPERPTGAGLELRSSFSAARDATVSTELYLRPPKKREGNICNRLIEYIFSY